MPKNKEHLDFIFNIVIYMGECKQIFKQLNKVTIVCPYFFAQVSLRAYLVIMLNRIQGIKTDRYTMVSLV